MVKFSIKTIWASRFHFRSILIVNTTLLIVIGLFKLFTSYWMTVYALLQIGPFHLNHQIHMYKVVCTIPSLSFWYICGTCNTILFHYGQSNLCLLVYFSVSLAKGLSILLTFAKNQLCVSLIFLYGFYLQFHWSLLLLLFLSACLRFILLFFSFLEWELRVFIDLGLFLFSNTSI